MILHFQPLNIKVKLLNIFVQRLIFLYEFSDHVLFSLDFFNVPDLIVVQLLVLMLQSFVIDCQHSNLIVRLV